MKSFFMGVAVGFGVGLMLAPEAGSETRKKIGERLDQAKDQAQQAAEPIIASVRESVSDRIDQVEELVQSGLKLAQQMPRGQEMQREDGIGQGGEMLDEAARLLQIFNNASKTKLMSVKGIGEATAKRIIDGRPYNNADGYAEILPEEVMHNLKKELLEEKEAA